MLRRIALAIALISGSLQADDRTLREQAECEESDLDSELAVAPDGRIASWGILRLVLPDLDDVGAEPEWVETPARPDHRGRLALDTLGGRAVVDAGGDAVGVVRGCLIHPSSGRVLALDVEIGPALDGAPRRVALAWSSLAVDRGSIRLVDDVDSLRSAPTLTRF